MVATLSLGLWEKFVKMVILGQPNEQVVKTLSGVIWEENGETLGGWRLPCLNLISRT